MQHESQQHARNTGVRLQMFADHPALERTWFGDLAAVADNLTKNGRPRSPMVSSIRAIAVMAIRWRDSQPSRLYGDLDHRQEIIKSPDTMKPYFSRLHCPLLRRHFEFSFWYDSVACERIHLSRGSPYFWVAIQAVMRSSRTSRGSAPESMTWSWKARISNLSPSSFLARSRSARISSWPIL